MERRRHQRFDYLSSVDYVVSPNGRSTTLRGMINNVSVSGICLYMLEPLDEGQEIIITDQPHFEHQRLKVCWTEEMSSDFYRSGLTFLQEE